MINLNEKGQSLVLFVILIPILVILFFFIFDFSLVMSNKIKLNDITKKSIDYILLDKKDITTVKKFIYDNDDNIEINEFTVDDNGVVLELCITIDSNFGRVIGYDEYEINSKYIGYLEHDKVIIREKG